jgi:glutamine synthetase
MVTTEDRAHTMEEVLAHWRDQGIRNIRFELPDMHGTSRSKIIPIEHADRYASKGLNMYGGAAVLDSRSDVVSGTLYNEEVAYADQLLRPDPSTAAMVPWAEATARLICDAFWSDGRPLMASPRHVFRQVLERCRDMGYEPLIGIEYEFYLLDPETHRPLFSGYHIFNTVRNTWVPVIERIVGEMREYGIDIITANCEYAGSQWEINYRPATGMAGPDQAFSFKNGVKELARQEGLLATFMTKPFADSAGCGAHTHMSLLSRDGGEPAFADTTDKDAMGFSPIGRQFIAGQLHRARSIYALLAPTVNCLKRRRTHTFSPTNISWGVEDRSAFLRVKEGSPEDRHIENRAPSGLSNPYLASAALLAAGILGITEGLELGPAGRPPSEQDPTLEPLPTTLEQSLQFMESDEKLVELLGSEFIEAYTVMRRYELARLADHVTDWELQEYLELY